MNAGPWTSPIRILPSMRLNTRLIDRRLPGRAWRWVKRQAAVLTGVRPPIRCDTLRNVAAAAGGSVAVRRQPREERFTLPTIATPEVVGWFRQHESHRFDEEVCCRIPSGRVVGPGVILSPDGTTIARDVSISFGEPDDAHWMLRETTIPPPRRLAGDTASVATISGHTYYHWLLEELPRFQAAAARGHDAIIAHRRLLGDWPDRIGCRARIVDAGSGHHFRCESLTVESLYGITGNPNAELVDIVRGIGAGLPAADIDYGDKIFVSRARASIRRLANEEHLWAHLEATGFRRLTLETMPWHHQVAAFARARVVVAPHGAGLANLLFCRPQTRIVELFHPGYLHWCFWHLASLCDMDYRPVVGDGDGPLRHDFRHNGSDITVAWDALSATLAD